MNHWNLLQSQCAMQKGSRLMFFAIADREVTNHKACLKSECTCRANIKYSMVYSEVVKGRIVHSSWRGSSTQKPFLPFAPYGRFSLTLLLHTVSCSQSAHASVFHFNYFSNDFFPS